MEGVEVEPRSLVPAEIETMEFRSGPEVIGFKALEFNTVGVANTVTVGRTDRGVGLMSSPPPEQVEIPKKLVKESVATEPNPVE